MNEAKEIMSSVQFCFTNNLGRSRPVIVELKPELYKFGFNLIYPLYNSFLRF
jgi:hypothetical protein